MVLWKKAMAQTMLLKALDGRFKRQMSKELSCVNSQPVLHTAFLGRFCMEVLLSEVSKSRANILWGFEAAAYLADLPWACRLTSADYLIQMALTAMLRIESSQTPASTQKVFTSLAYLLQSFMFA